MIEDYIKNKIKNHYSISGIEVFIDQPFINEVDVQETIFKLISIVPGHLLSNVNRIKIGNYKELLDRDLTAMYKNSTIYVTNQVTDEEDLIDDLIHETSHSVEEKYSDVIYSDGEIRKEFVSKRKKLLFTLKNMNYDLAGYNFLDVEYDINFDNFLYKNIGYPTLRKLTSGLFYSPYAATCLREYFANGFEAFYMKEDLTRLRKTSPKLYEKLLYLLNLQKEKENRK